MTTTELVTQSLLGKKLVVNICIDGWRGRVRTGKLTGIYGSLHNGGFAVYWKNREGIDCHLNVYPSTHFEIIPEKKGKGK